MSTITSTKLRPIVVEALGDGETPVISLPTLTTPRHNQKLFGKRSLNAADVEEFRGIPYGSVPGRWQHSQMRTRLPSDVFDATKNGPRCVQPSGPNNTATFQSHLDFPTDVTESEFDCLNLFISRPSKAALVRAGLDGHLGRLPVYFYIHGGAYAFGAGTDPMWDPARLVAQSIVLKKPILVAQINYRLNVFGFAASSDILAQQDGDARGCNFGIADQRIALAWVSENIAAFGGNPNDITVGGQSAGASSAHAHVLDASSSLATPLMKKAIVQSAAVGTLGPESLADADVKWGNLCERFQLKDLSARDRFTSLAEVPATNLLEAANPAGWQVFPMVNDELTLKKNKSEDGWDTSFGPKNVPRQSQRDSASEKPIRVLIGDTDVEASIYYDVISTISTIDRVETALKSVSVSSVGREEIMQKYDLVSSTSPEELRKQLFTLLTDVFFGVPVDRARRSLNASPSTKAASYRIQYGNPFQGPHYQIAQHCVDLLYIYDCFHDDLRQIDTSGLEDSTLLRNEDLVQQMQSDWINFITSNGDASAGEDTADTMTVYGHDRRASKIKLSEDSSYLERKGRYDVLQRHWQDAVKIANAIVAC